MAAAYRRLQRNRWRRNILVRPRVFRYRSNPLDQLETIEEFEIYQRYRFCPDTINFIVNGVNDQLIADTKRATLLQSYCVSVFCCDLGPPSPNCGQSRDFRVICWKIRWSCCCRHRRCFFQSPNRLPRRWTVATKVKEGFKRVAGFPKFKY